MMPSRVAAVAEPSRIETGPPQTGTGVGVLVLVEVLVGVGVLVGVAVGTVVAVGVGVATAQTLSGLDELRGAGLPVEKSEPFTSVSVHPLPALKSAVVVEGAGAFVAPS